MIVVDARSATAVGARWRDVVLETMAGALLSGVMGASLTSVAGAPPFAEPQATDADLITKT